MLSSIFRSSSLIGDDNTLGIRHLFLLGEFKGIIESNNPHSMENFIEKNETLFKKKIVLGKYHCNLLHILCYGDKIPFNPPHYVNRIVDIKHIIENTIVFFENHYSCFIMIPEIDFTKRDSNGKTPVDIAYEKIEHNNKSSLKMIGLLCKRFGKSGWLNNKPPDLILTEKPLIKCNFDTNSASKTQSAGTKKRKYSKRKKNTYKRKFKNLKKKNK